MRLRPRLLVKLVLAFLICLLLVHLVVIASLRQPEDLTVRDEDFVKHKSKRLKETSAIHPPILKEELGNFEPVLERRSGPGEGGEAAFAAEDEKDEEKRMLLEYGFDMFVSDKISLDRSTKDLREPECKYWHYPTQLPNASVIIIFHNEPFGTVVRTVHSVVNTVPKQYLAEVILLDDASTRARLMKPLEDHMSELYGDLVKIVRSKDKGGRQGLIRARVMGAEAATRGEVLVFLDSHCEANPNWYPPLATPIALNKKSVPVPLVDGIDAMTFEMRPQSIQHQQGGFDWDFNYKRYDVPQAEKDRHKYQTEPYWSPVMAGGLFAIHKDFFWELGGYDRGLEVWGAEQYEISFKAWMCGGEVLFVPCSRVGHIYKVHVPGFKGVNEPVAGPSAPGTRGASWGDLNHMRVAEVWMDEYKEDFYISKPNLVGKNFGDVSQMKEIRRQCNADPERNSFRWFMEHVAYDLPKHYPRPFTNVVWGEWRNQGGDRDRCLDNMGASFGGEIGVSDCHQMGGSQYWRITEGKELRWNENCINTRGDSLIMVFCHGTKDYFIWTYDKEDMTLRDDQGRCVEHIEGTYQARLTRCDPSNSFQKWDVKPTI